MTTYAVPGYSAATTLGQPFADAQTVTALILMRDAAATLGYAVTPEPGPGVGVVLSGGLLAVTLGVAERAYLQAHNNARLQEVIWDGGAARAQFLFFAYDIWDEGLSPPDMQRRSAWILVGGDTPPAFADAAAMQAFFATATAPGPGSGLDGPAGLIPLAGLAVTEDDLLDNRIIRAVDSLDGGLGDDTLIGNGDAVLYGGEGDDLVWAPLDGGLHDTDIANDSLYGGAGNDTLRGSREPHGSGDRTIGSDRFYGGDGNDRIEAFLFHNLLEGGAGNDTLIGANNSEVRHVSYRDYLQGSHDTLYGGAGDDRMFGGNGYDVIVSPSGVYEFGSFDLLYGGTGDDTMFGGEGYDTLHGDEGDDLLFGDHGSDLLYGGAGNDIMLGDVDTGLAGPDTEVAGDTLHGDAGDDRIYGSMGEDELYGGAGNDTLYSHLRGTWFVNGEDIPVPDRGDLLDGGTGSDLLYSGAGDDTLTGGDDEDLLFGGSDQDSLDGGAGADRLDGGTGDDTMEGGLGNDTYVVDSAGDVVQGEIGFSLGGGIDTVEVWISNFVAPTNVELIRLQGTENLTATGNNAPGTLVGNSGANTLLGRGGNDQINGNAGNDTITGGVGADTLIGGVGADHFVFTAEADSRATPEERDFINGFTHGQDRINLSAIDANPFLTGDQAFRFIGNAAFSGDGAASAGQMRFQAYGGNWNIVSIDRDGNGVAEMQIFVNLTNFMTGSDFIL